MDEVRYTCLMSVYEKESPENLNEAINSVMAQTIPPEEFLIVKDGRLSQRLEKVLHQHASASPEVFTFISFPNNRGLHVALREGILAARNELIMRMDSDDICDPCRAEAQLCAFDGDAELCCVGSNVAEFLGRVDNIVAHVSLPLAYDQIVAYSTRRNPMRHPSMMYKKSSVVDAGNYRDLPFFEDWDLVLRLIETGGHLKNLPEELVLMRVSEDFYQRRGGASYFTHTRSFLSLCRKEGRLSDIQYVRSMAERFVQCFLPNCVRDWAYRHLLRQAV